MNELEHQAIQCPYCGERIDITIDCTDIGQSYIEDCEVCCRPINMQIGLQEDGKITVAVSNENE